MFVYWFDWFNGLVDFDCGCCYNAVCFGLMFFVLLIGNSVVCFSCLVFIVLDRLDTDCLIVSLLLWLAVVNALWLEVCVYLLSVVVYFALRFVGGFDVLWLFYFLN